MYRSGSPRGTRAAKRRSANIFIGTGCRQTWFYAKRVQETAMHWRKVPGEANSQAFYVVALIAAVALTATLLLHLHVPPH
jgi:hypothetical protein